MSGTQPAESGASSAERTITFHYVKSNFFRVVHSDGAVGGITPRGLIEINHYSERQPIPQSVTHRLPGSGVLGEEVLEKRLQRDGPVREVDIGVLLSLENARSLHKWLGEKIEELEKLRDKGAPNARDRASS